MEDKKPQMPPELAKYADKSWKILENDSSAYFARVLYEAEWRLYNARKMKKMMDGMTASTTE